MLTVYLKTFCHEIFVKKETPWSGGGKVVFGWKRMVGKFLDFTLFFVKFTNIDHNRLNTWIVSKGLGLDFGNSLNYLITMRLIVSFFKFLQLFLVTHQHIIFTVPMAAMFQMMFWKEWYSNYGYSMINSQWEKLI